MRLKKLGHLISIILCLVMLIPTFSSALQASSTTASVPNIQSVADSTYIDQGIDSTTPAGVTSSVYKDMVPLNFTPADSVIDPQRTVIYMTDLANKKVHSVNYITGETKEISFDLPPERLTFSNNKLYITLLEGQHSSYWWKEEQKGAIAIVNSESLKLEKEFEIETDPFDIVVDKEGYINIVSGSGQWTNISSYSSLSKQLISTSYIRQASYADYNPSLNRIYTINTDISPRDYEAYDISGGYFKGYHDSPYHGDYQMNTNFKVSPDGKYIFNGSGLILSCDSDNSNDLRFLYMLNKQFNDIAFDIKNKRFYTAVSGCFINVYNYNTFQGIDRYETKGNIQTLFCRDNKLIAISTDSQGKSIIENIDTKPDPTEEWPMYNISVSQGNDSSCIISFDTDEPSVSWAVYGKDNTYGSITQTEALPVKHHAINVQNLMPKTMYHFKITSKKSNGIQNVSDDLVFMTNDLPYINLGTKVSKVVYDRLNDKAYAIDSTGNQLLVVDLLSSKVEKNISLSSKPLDLCITEKGDTLYILSNNTVSEYDAVTCTKLRDIQCALPADNYSDSYPVSHYHIYYRNSQLFILDSNWAPGLRVLNLKTLELKDLSSSVNGIGDMWISEDGSNIYSWYQSGWCSFENQCNVQQYKLSGDNYIKGQTSNTTYPTGMNSVPFDTPVLVPESGDKIICKNKVFDMKDLSKELHTFDDNIYAVTSDGNIAIGKKNFYNLSDFSTISAFPKQNSSNIFLDKSQNLYMLDSSQTMLYYSKVLSAPAANPEISPDNINYNLSVSKDLKVSIKFNGHKLVAIANGQETLMQGKDYTLSESDVTISKNYLENIFKNSNKDIKLTFDFGGEYKVLTIALFIESSISPEKSVYSTSLTADLNVTLTLNGNSLTSIMNGKAPLIPSIDYTVSDNKVCIKKSFFNYYFNKFKQNLKLVFVFSSGDSKELTVSPVFPDKSALSPDTITYDLLKHQDVKVVLNLATGEKLASIKSGTSSLIPITDYTVSGNTVTIKGSYFGYYFGKFKQNLKLVFILSSGREAAFTAIPVYPDNPSISPQSVSYNLSTPGDVTVNLTLNGNTLSTIKSGAASLIPRVDYVLSGNTVIIKQSFMDYYFNKFGQDLKLDFVFCSGNSIVFTVSPLYPVD